MIILWIRKKKAEEQKLTEKKDNPPFHEHDDIMKRFRFAHPDINFIDAKDILTAEGNVLAPIREIKLTEHTQN